MLLVSADGWRHLGFANVQNGTVLTTKKMNKVGGNAAAEESERVLLLCGGMLEGQTAIKNRAGSATLLFALTRCEGMALYWSRFDHDHVYIRRFMIDYRGKALSISGDAVRNFWNT